MASKPSPSYDDEFKIDSWKYIVVYLRHLWSVAVIELMSGGAFFVNSLILKFPSPVYEV